MQVPTAVVVGERPPGIARDPIQSGGSVGPATPAVGLPVVIDIWLPGAPVFDVYPPAVLAQGTAVAVGVDGGVGREAGTMTLCPVVQRCGRGAESGLELGPGVVDAANENDLAASNDRRTPLGDDFGETVQHGDLGPAVAVAVDLVPAALFGVDPGIGGVHGRQLRVQQMVCNFEPEAPAVKDVERVRIVAVGRAGDLREGHFAVVVQGEDRAVGHQHRETGAGSGPDPVAAQDRQVEFQLALRTGANCEQRCLAFQGADEAVDTVEAFRFVRYGRLRGAGGACAESERDDQQSRRDWNSHLSSPIRVSELAR